MKKHQHQKEKVTEEKQAKTRLKTRNREAADSQMAAELKNNQHTGNDTGR